MAKIVNKYNLGVISDDFTPKNLAKKISELTPEKIMNYKNNSHKSAKELSSESNKQKLLKIVDDLI